MLKVINANEAPAKDEIALKRAELTRRILLLEHEKSFGNSTKEKIASLESNVELTRQEIADLEKNIKKTQSDARLEENPFDLSAPYVDDSPVELPPAPPEVKNETETTMRMPSPQKSREVGDIIEKFNLDSLLPREFENLRERQKIRVLENLKRRMVDIVKSDAETQYSETWKKKSWGGKIWSGISKEKDLKNLEKKVFGEIKNTNEGKELIKRDLEVLVKRAENQEIAILGDGRPHILYFEAEKGFREPEIEATDNFNIKANEFAGVPYEWGQEKNGRNKKKYEKIKAEYEKARSEILEIKLREERPDEKGQAMLKILETDNLVQMEQLLNTHPEFEQALGDFERSASGKEAIKTAGNFLETMTGGKNLTNKLLTAGGFGARMAARGAVMASGMTVITALAAPVIGGIIGYWRGKIRAVGTLEERQKEARRGKKDESKEKVATVDALHLSKRLEEIMDEITDLSKLKTQPKRLAQLSARIDHTQGKIEKGQVNFGDAKSALVNQFNLINSLNKALVLMQIMPNERSKETREKIDSMLGVIAGNIAEKTSQAQEEFIKKQAKRGMWYGAGFASAGYALRYFGEYMGWWGHGAEHVALKTVKVPEYHAVENIHAEHTHTPTLEPTLTSAPTPIPTPENISSHVDLPTLEPAAENLPTASITFDHGKGAIEGILELKNQMRENYHGNFSSAPQNIQDFMKETNVTRQAIKLGLFHPNNPSESALIREGTVVKFDEHGNLLFGKPDAYGNIPVLEKYHGKMFDAGHQTETELPPKPAPAEILKEKIETPPEPTPVKSAPEEITPKPRPVEVRLEDVAQEPPKPTPVQALKEKIETQINAAEKPEVAPEPEAVTLVPKIFTENPFNLSENKLLEVYDASRKNIEFIFGEKNSLLWENLKDAKAKLFTEYTKAEYNDLTDSNPPVARLADYLRLLRNFSGLKPKGSGLLRLGKPDTTESYIVRALQKITERGQLEDFETSLRK